MSRKLDFHFSPTTRWRTTLLPAEQLSKLCDDLANGFLNREYRYRQTFIVGTDNPINGWNFWDHLGEFVEISNHRQVLIRYKLPMPEDVIARLQFLRRKIFADYRKLFASPEEWVKHLRRENTSKEEAIRGAAEMYPTQIFARDLMLLYVCAKYGRIPEPCRGWKNGMRIEMELLASKIRPRGEWSSQSRNYFDRFFVEDEETGTFVLPTKSGAGAAHQTSGASGTKKLSGPRRDPERLLFYMSQPEYIGIRSLSGDNPYDYGAVEFERDRLILDTAEVGNRLFCLEGPLAVCLEVAEYQRKGQIVTSPVYRKRIVHGSSGNWKKSVTRWLTTGE